MRAIGECAFYRGITRINKLNNNGEPKEDVVSTNLTNVLVKTLLYFAE